MKKILIFKMNTCILKGTIEDKEKELSKKTGCKCIVIDSKEDVISVDIAGTK